MFSSLDSYIQEYLESEYFLFLDPHIKPVAEKALTALRMELGPDSSDPSGLEISQLEKFVLGNHSFFQTNPGIREKIPQLLKGFFEFLSSSGRFPQAANWLQWIPQLEHWVESRTRKDGTVKGETHVKKYEEVGRNDPCPCGSGLKFKKCCLPLINKA